jgi:hypothetical protein
MKAGNIALPAVDALQAQLLDWPVLQGLVGAFLAALGLRAVGAVMSMLSVCRQRPNWVMPSSQPPTAKGWLMQNTLCLSL